MTAQDVTNEIKEHSGLTVKSNIKSKTSTESLSWDFTHLIAYDMI